MRFGCPQPARPAVRPGSAPKGNETGPPGASRAGFEVLRPRNGHLGRAGAERVRMSWPADVAELAAAPGRPGRAAGVVAVGVAVPTPATGVETEAFNQAGSSAS